MSSKGLVALSVIATLACLLLMEHPRHWVAVVNLRMRLHQPGRSLPHLIEVIGSLEARGVGFRLLIENVDTTTPGGRLIFHVFRALVQFERDLIRERTKAGLAAAARGRRGGRKPVVNDEKLQPAREHIAKGLNVRETAARLKIGKTALYAALRATSSE